MRYLAEDNTSILLHVRHEEELLSRKRRYLMGLVENPSSNCSRKRLKTPEFLADLSMPESILRDDDVSMETMKSTIERSFEAFFGNQKVHRVVQDYQQFFNMNIADRETVKRTLNLVIIPSIIDDLNNNALCLLASIVTGNSVKFDKTRPKMKSIVKKYLPLTFRKTNLYTDCANALTQISALLQDPQNFRGNFTKFVTYFCPSHRSYANWVIERLSDFRFQALHAMNRKLKGLKRMPKLQPTRPGGNKSVLVKWLQRKYKKILSELREGDEMPKHLVSSLTVASLSIKQMAGREDSHAPELSRVPLEIEALQQNILKAIWAIQYFPFAQLKHLQLLLNPNAKISRRSRRKYIKRLLIEYLFECSELEIPESVLRAVTVINKKSKYMFTKEKMEDELGCVLDMSSHLRQMVWDLSLHPDIDQDFANAYMDDSESDDDSVDGYKDEDYDSSCSNFENTNNLNMLLDDACFGNSDQKQIHKPLLDVKQEINTAQFTIAKEEFIGNFAQQPKSEQIVEPFSISQHGLGLPSNFKELTKPTAPNSCLDERENKRENEYLIIQDISDETSLFAHRFIGRLIEELLLTEGNELDTTSRLYLRGGGTSVPQDFQDAGGLQGFSKEDVGSQVLIHVLEEFIPPSFPKSVLEGIKELLGSR